MRRSILAASAAFSALAFLASADVAAAACARAVATANSGGSYGVAGCGSLLQQSASPGGTASAAHNDPVGYTHPEVAASLGGGVSSARANLADASLHGTATSTAIDFSNSKSEWSETLIFTNTTGVNQYLAIGWLVEGDVTWAPGQGATAISNFSISTRHQRGIQEGYLGYFSSNGDTYDINGAYNAFGWYPTYPGQGGAFGAAYAGYDLGGDSRLMTSVFGIAPGTGIVDVAAFLDLSARSGASLNYGATGALLFGALPTGVSFTSESGVFKPGMLALPGQGGAVPEPATWAMMILGFGMAGSALRRRRFVVA